jgi:hypothetical protein
MVCMKLAPRCEHPGGAHDQMRFAGGMDRVFLCKLAAAVTLSEAQGSVSRPAPLAAALKT